MNNVVAMKQQRWSEKGVDYETVPHGELTLIPNPQRLVALGKDHQSTIDSKMFFKTPAAFDDIIQRLNLFQREFNRR